MITDDVRRRVLRKIKPDEKEVKTIQSKCQQFIGYLEKAVSDMGLQVTFVVGGSFGKKTFLKGDFDIDVFCKFDLVYASENLSAILKKILENAKLRAATQKGSRDYFSIKYSGIEYELVPVLDISSIEDAKNSTDLSPLHVKYVLDNTTEEVRDEIRLAKMFFKAKEVYGAESYINAFSGHVIDLLIMFYRSLNNLIRETRLWGEKTFIDVQGHYKSLLEVEKKFDKNKLGNLVVIDPVVPLRNAASAVSCEKYYRFIDLCLASVLLTEEDFVMQEERLDRVLKSKLIFARANGFVPFGYWFELGLGTETKDIVGAKMLKLYGRILQLIKSYDFTVFTSVCRISFSENRCLFVYLVEEQKLPLLKLVKGPTVLMHDAVHAFREEHGDEVFLDVDTLYAHQKRKIASLREIYLSKEDFEKMVNRDLSFIKKIKVIH